MKENTRIKLKISRPVTSVFIFLKARCCTGLCVNKAGKQASGATGIPGSSSVTVGELPGTITNVTNNTGFLTVLSTEQINAIVAAMENIQLAQTTNPSIVAPRGIKRPSTETEEGLPAQKK